MIRRAVLGADPIDGFLGPWALGAVVLDEIVVVMPPHDPWIDGPPRLEHCLESVRPGGGMIRCVSLMSWPELEAVMLEGGWATILPLNPGTTIFGEKPDGDEPPVICAYDETGPTIAEAVR